MLIIHLVGSAFSLPNRAGGGVPQTQVPHLRISKSLKSLRRKEASYLSWLASIGLESILLCTEPGSYARTPVDISGTANDKDSPIFSLHCI